MGTLTISFDGAEDRGKAIRDLEELARRTDASVRRVVRASDGALTTAFASAPGRTDDELREAWDAIKSQDPPVLVV